MTDLATATIQGAIVEPATKPRKRADGVGRAVMTQAAQSSAVVENPSLLAMLQAVIARPDTSIERVNQTFDFYQRVEAAQARKAFDSAMAAAKADFGQITKKHTVHRGSGGGSYKHEDLADIAAAVDLALANHGLSYRFRATSNANEPITVTCIVTHRDGHFEETTLSAAADPSGGKNSIQAIGSTLSYLQRYSLRLALGIAAGREDDGKAAGEAPAERITEQQAKDLEARAAKANIDLQIIFEHFRVQSLAELTPLQHKTALAKINKKLELQGA